MLAADAAERRAAQESYRGLLNARRDVRPVLIGRITDYYHLAGREPPFGLRMATVVQLKKHLAFMRQKARREEKAAKRLYA